MPKYEITFTEELWKAVTIEAGSHKEALEKFHHAGYDESTERITGGELQDSIEVEELEEEN